MEKSTKAIRKELAILIKEKHKSCLTDKDRNRAVEDARQEINIKYGKGWRERDMFKPYKKEHTKVSDYFLSVYDDHPNGEHWMD